MIRDFHMGDEKQTGFYVGILTSTFALCQLLTGTHFNLLLFYNMCLNIFIDYVIFNRVYII